MVKNIVMIMVTCASRKEALEVSGRLLARRLVACASIMPGVDSKFWWKGKLDRAAEVLIIMKTVKKNFKKIEAQIKRAHSYEVPEIIAVPIVACSRDYLDWVSRAVVGM